ncbi:hypothetical protein N0B44_27810 [Roseibacterium beibuensis]|uniref:DUF4870 domain-containing protein n=1 Tax=[Roseibacterium] beibuensis TaxID=1193142 RepID=A0ABP9LSZ2_9RHOB|nr:hypothetical protein [Roseibacterium beibuensis]MCS6626732.1 hypothetical protein [Roseibacterium beibuensis]
MQDTPPPPPQYNQGQPYQAPPPNPLEPAFIIYITYIVGFVVPFAALGGLIYAYIERGKSPELDSHLTFQIRTFWWGVLMMVIGFVLTFVLVGFLVFLFWLVWTGIRIVTGLQLAQNRQPIRSVEVWGMKAV